MLLAACAAEAPPDDAPLACDDEWYFCDVSYRVPGEELGFVLSHEGAFTASVSCEGCEIDFSFDQTRMLTSGAAFDITAGAVGDAIVTAEITDVATGEVERSSLAFEILEPDRMTAHCYYEEPIFEEHPCNDGDVPAGVDTAYVAFVVHAEDLARPMFVEVAEYPSGYTTRDLAFMNDELGRGWVAMYRDDDYAPGPVEVTGSWGDLDATVGFTFE